MNYKHYVRHFIFISSTLILLYTSDVYFKISNHIVFSNACNTLVSILSQYSLSHMKAYEAYDKTYNTYDYEVDDANVIEYTESSVEAYFNEYLRLEQKYTMRPRYGIARAVIERSLRDEAIENFDKATVSVFFFLLLHLQHIFLQSTNLVIVLVNIIRL